MQFVAGFYVVKNFDNKKRDQKYPENRDLVGGGHFLRRTPFVASHELSRGIGGTREKRPAVPPVLIETARSLHYTSFSAVLRAPPSRRPPLKGSKNSAYPRRDSREFFVLSDPGGRRQREPLFCRIPHWFIGQATIFCLLRRFALATSSYIRKFHWSAFMKKDTRTLGPKVGIIMGSDTDWP